MWSSLIAYCIIVSLCAKAFYILGLYYPPHLTLLQAFLESITAFHGRVFSELFNTYTPQIWVTAFLSNIGISDRGCFHSYADPAFY